MSTGGKMCQLDEVRAPAATSLPLNFQLADDIVRLRGMTVADARMVNQACADPEIIRFTRFAQPRDFSDTRDWIESQPTLRRRGEAIDFAIVPVGGVVMIGSIGISSIQFKQRRARLGCWVASRTRGRGFATAAVRLLSSWAIGPPLELARLELAIDARNTPARRAAEHAGYELEAMMRSYMLVRGRRQDAALYSLIAPAG
jgi:RimJ/RimL family protein N-acetyltransferase